MKSLFPFLKPYRRDCVLAPAFKLMEAAMDLFVPLVIAEMINSGITQGAVPSVVRCFFILLLLAVLGMGFSFTAQWFASRASVGCAGDIRQALFNHIQGLSFRELDQLGASTLVTRLTSDVNQVQNGLNLTLRLALRSPFIVFGAMVMAFTIDTSCALIFAVAIPILLALVFAVMLRCIPLYAKVQALLDRLMGAVRENLTGVRVIRAFCKEQEETKAFAEKNNALTRMNEAVGRLAAVMNPATYLIINIAAILLLRQGALRVEAGVLQQGSVVALYNYMAQITVELIKLASLIITINKSLACAGRVSQVMQERSSMAFPVQDAHPVLSSPDALRFDDVCFSYAQGGEEALNQISFSLPRGSVLGVIGGTGSGKTTLAALICRFYDTTRGTVFLFGQDVRQYTRALLRAQIGLVPQQAVLFEGTLRDNLLWGNGQATDAELWAALDAAQARDVVLSKNMQLDETVEQGGRNFSGGQRQRLCIARALVKKPPLLILDDSSSALDYATDLHLRQAIHHLPWHPTVVIISQRASSVKHADCVLVLDDGQLAGQGTHDALLERCGVYREIYYSQFPEEKPAAGGKEGCL